MMEKQHVLAFNERNIAEFRSSGGKLGGPFEGAPVLLLTTEELLRRRSDRLRGVTGR